MIDHVQHTTLAKVAQYIDAMQLPKNDKSMLVTVSGGADSVALLLTLKRLGYTIVAAHCNFHLRGDESMRDQLSVSQLCDTQKVPLIIKDFDVAGYRERHPGTSIEMACRELRYQWFESERIRLSLDYIAVAHHADDNIETFMLNATRGTGIAGLKAMQPVSGKIFRPLLCLTRDEITSFLTEANINWVTDSTNAENDFKRNALRNIALPTMQKAVPNAKNGLRSTINFITDDFLLMSELLNKLRPTLLQTSDRPNQYIINTTELLKFDNKSHLLFSLIKDFGFNASQCRDVIGSLLSSDRDGAAYFYSPTHFLHLNSTGKLTLNEHIISDKNEYLFTIKHKLELKRPIFLQISEISNTKFNRNMVDGKWIIPLDRRWKNKELTLRLWREGDRMRPFGLNGTRLLSDIFNDAHLPATEKRQQWVLTDDKGNILWVPGIRASQLTAVEPDSNFFILKARPSNSQNR